jgi:5-hydroxyisourate hydrolase
MRAITTHVLDTAAGQPAAGLLVRLERAGGTGWTEIGRASTDADGRVREPGLGSVEPGTYRLIFDTGTYRRAQQAAVSSGPPFFPEVAVTFTVSDQPRNYHVPLLLSPFGFTVYRGS